MRKGVSEGRAAKITLSKKSLASLESNGYKFVLVKGLTIDNHYDHVDPHYLVLVPLKELPADPGKKDIYAPIESEILQQWANEKNGTVEIVIINNLFS
jgi:hypothetical protein